MNPQKMNFTDEEKMAITLLNNISELILQSNDRKSALDVLRAFEVFVKNKKINVSQEKIDNFKYVLLDSRPSTLNSLLRNIIQDILAKKAK